MEKKQNQETEKIPISSISLNEVAAINSLCFKCNKEAVSHGWWEQERTFGDIVALIHSEVSEALEFYRKHGDVTYQYWDTKNNMKLEGVPSELADVLIRIFDFCGMYNIDLGRAIRDKMNYNIERPHRHGGKHL